MIVTEPSTPGRTALRSESNVGDILKMRTADVGLSDMAVAETPDGELCMAQVIQLERDEVSLQVFSGGRGLLRGCTYYHHSAALCGAEKEY